MRRKLQVHAELAAADPREDLWQRLAATYPYLVEYQERSQRKIPVAILRPVDAYNTITDSRKSPA